jgi:hypothetical protein
MGYRAHAVTKCEEYSTSSYFNWSKDELENLFANMGDDFYFLEDDPNRTEISLGDMEKVIANVTAEDIEEAGLFKDSTTPMEEKVALVKQYLQEIYDDADKTFGAVILAWF